MTHIDFKTDRNYKQIKINMLKNLQHLNYAKDQG